MSSPYRTLFFGDSLLYSPSSFGAFISSSSSCLDVSFYSPPIRGRESCTHTPAPSSIQLAHTRTHTRWEIVPHSDKSNSTPAKPVCVQFGVAGPKGFQQPKTTNPAGRGWLCRHRACFFLRSIIFVSVRAQSKIRFVAFGANLSLGLGKVRVRLFVLVFLAFLLFSSFLSIRSEKEFDFRFNFRSPHPPVLLH